MSFLRWLPWRRDPAPGPRSNDDRAEWRVPDAPPTPEELRDEQLSAYLDGELSPAEAAALERQLAADPSLRAQLEELRTVSSALAGLGELAVPRPFTIEAPPRRATSRLPRLELLTRAGAAVAALALAAVITTDLAGIGADDPTPKDRAEITALATEAPAAGGEELAASTAADDGAAGDSSAAGGAGPIEPTGTADFAPGGGDAGAGEGAAPPTADATPMPTAEATNGDAARLAEGSDDDGGDAAAPEPGSGADGAGVASSPSTAPDEDAGSTEGAAPVTPEPGDGASEDLPAPGPDTEAATGGTEAGSEAAAGATTPGGTDDAAPAGTEAADGTTNRAGETEQAAAVPSTEGAGDLAPSEPAGALVAANGDETDVLMVVELLLLLAMAGFGLLAFAQWALRRHRTSSL